MRELSDYFITKHSSITQAIEVIDRGGAQIALVVEGKVLLGTVTDGDVRRALLRGETLDSSVTRIMRTDFKFLSGNASEDDALELMRRETLHQIPSLDESGRVVQLFLLEELIKPRVLTNAIVIMAGGEGKRLRPLTQNCPKPMLLIAGKPLLEIIMQQCINAGFCNFYFAVNYLKTQIKDYFQDGSRWGVKIRYLEEDKPLGTAGALSLLPQLPDEPMLVLNGDVLTRVDITQLLRFHMLTDAAATLCVRQHTTQIPYGVVHLDNELVLGLEEKPLLTHYVNAGIYFLKPHLLELIPKNTFFDMPQLLEIAAKQSFKVCAFPIHEYWLDVGHPETLERAIGDWP